MVSTIVDLSKVEVRKYVLVSSPSRWNQRGDRVVVQSPVLNISKDISHIPVRRFSGEEENCVCYLPCKDIEKDSSSVYEKLRVSQTPSWVDAHGVAIVDSESNEVFEYGKGDQFWLCVGASTNAYQRNVPVINLRTRGSGSIGIDRVCWYPKIRGPNEEIWTPGGQVRKLKLSGSKKYSCWSWVICQNLDGANATTKNVEIPSKDSTMPDRSALSVVERKALFERWHAIMLKALSPSTPHNDSNASTTPPFSAEVTYWQNHTGHVKASVEATAQDRMPYKHSTTHKLNHKPQQYPVIPAGNPVISRRTASTTSSCESPILLDGHIDSSESSYVISECESVLSRPLTRSPGISPAPPPFLPSCNSEDNNSSKPSPDVARNADMIQSAIDLWKTRRALIAKGASPKSAPPPPSIVSYITGCSTGISGLCDHGIQDCKYSSKYPFKHFHPPSDKCRLGHLEDHEHCVSQDRALPDRSGNCILASSLRIQGHKCCYWALQDRLNSNWMQEDKPYDDRKQKEARKMGLNVMDIRHLVNEDCSKGLSFDIRGCEELDEAGRQLLEGA